MRYKQTNKLLYREVDEFLFLRDKEIDKKRQIELMEKNVDNFWVLKREIEKIERECK